MKKLLVVVFFVVNLFAATDYQDAYVLYKSGQFKPALAEFKRLANEYDDYDAAYILGFMYEHGEGTEIDLKESEKWYKFSSHGYYWKDKNNPSRDISKEEEKLVRTINKSDDTETMATIRQVAEAVYSFKAHHANYFLPVSYRYNSKYPDTYGHKALPVESEFQISLKYDFGANVIGLNEIYTIAYTQLSFWQLYAESAFFRETNYNPEMFITIPIAHIKKFDYFKAIRIGFEHKSNGRGGLEERSWNYVAGRFYIQTGPVFFELQAWQNVGSLDYNTDLMKYMGYGQVKLLLPYKKHLLTVISRNPFSQYRATEMNYSYPLSKENNLFLYIKTFNGYGESLIDYNEKVHKVGLGVSITR